MVIENLTNKQLSDLYLKIVEMKNNYSFDLTYFLNLGFDANNWSTNYVFGDFYLTVVFEIKDRFIKENI